MDDDSFSLGRSHAPRYSALPISAVTGNEKMSGRARVLRYELCLRSLAMTAKPLLIAGPVPRRGSLPSMLFLSVNPSVGEQPQAKG